jgi:hypothetical protein
MQKKKKIKTDQERPPKWAAFLSRFALADDVSLT